jgi:hypothetical protein
MGLNLIEPFILAMCPLYMFNVLQNKTCKEKTRTHLVAKYSQLKNLVVHFYLTSKSLIWLDRPTLSNGWRWINRWIEGWIDSWIEGWIDSWIEGWIDR